MRASCRTSRRFPRASPSSRRSSRSRGNLELLNPFGGTANDQDMYRIYISDPACFSAFTQPPVAADGAAGTCGPTLTAPTARATAFDSQMWLFDADGFGILGNDEVGFESGFGNAATDGSGAAVTAPGIYYLAISAFNADPVNGTGAALFDQPTVEVSGPDGPGGSDPIADWSVDGAGTGAYTILLTGTAFPPVCETDCADGNGETDIEDLLALLAQWGGTGSCDIAPAVGIVDIADLLALLAGWGPCVVPPPT